MQPTTVWAPQRRACSRRAGSIWGAVLALVIGSACSSSPSGDEGRGGAPPDAMATAGTPGSLPVGGATAGASAAPSATAGASGNVQLPVAGSAATNAGSGTAGSGGAAGDEAGAGGTGSMAGSGGSDGMATPGPIDYALDCGPSAIVLEGHGPPANRVNYVIVGDGYDADDLETTYVEHLNSMLEPRFGPEFEPYGRYRNFVNICALKVPSAQSGIGTQAGDTAFDGYGNDQSRLGYIDDQKVNAKIEELLPAEIEVDWKAVVLNDASWWNSGGRIMVWSGGHQDAPLAAEHEGGHAFQILADEYGGDCTFSGSEGQMRVNVTMDNVDTAGKWSLWLDFDHTPGTGLQGTFEGAQFCDRGAWRPSDESVMNMLWDSSYYNAVSRENGVRVIYDMVDPIDSSTPGSVTTPQVLEVKVIDPAVLSVEWSVDGEVVSASGGEHFDVAAQGLASGSHTIAARAYDDTEWVRGERAELEQRVEWTIEVP